MRSTSLDFAGQVRHLLRSFPVSQDQSPEPDSIISLVLGAPSRNRSIRPFHFLYNGGSRIGRTTHPWQLFRLLEHQLDMLLADNVDTRLLVHAGAVSRNGSGIILPGPSGSGKSSLTLALVRQGYRYLSDEIAGVDRSTGCVYPFPKPFSIKNTSLFPGLGDVRDCWYGPDSAEPGGIWYLHPEDLVDRAIGGARPVRHIIFPTYDPQRQPGIQRLSQGQALRELISNAINLPLLGSSGLRLAASMVKEAQCHALITNDLASAVELVDGIVGA